MNDWYKILVVLACALMVGLFIHETRVMKHGFNKWLWRNPYKRSILICAFLTVLATLLIVFFQGWCDV